MFEAQAQDELLCETQNGVLILTLNRPKALNALSLAMIGTLDSTLREAAKDPTVHSILLQGSGDRAFCAGGDVRAVAQAGNQLLAKVFFRAEYTLNHLLHVYPKPVIPLIHGICMGGGAGLSAHCPHRVATDRLIFAMPETSIGLFPDVGGTWFLNRMPGEIGLYLALTGERLTAADAYATGFATHCIKDEDRPALRAALIEASPKTNAEAAVTIARFAQSPGHSQLLTHRAEIDRLFAGNSLEEIRAALVSDGGVWAKAQMETLALKSPTSLKITLRQLRGGKNLDIVSVFIREYRMSQHCVASPDFREGIRALLIDKDQSPNWSPRSLEAITAAQVENFFAPLPGFELDLTVNERITA